MPEREFQPTKINSKAEWGERKTHEVVLPSGSQVTIQIPNLPELIEAGELPNHLIDTAIDVAQGKQITAEHLKNQAEFYRAITLVSVVDPSDLTEDDLKPGGVVPFEDIELIAELATRQRDVDALGRHIGGLHTSEEWRRFRGLDIGD